VGSGTKLANPLDELRAYFDAGQEQRHASLLCLGACGQLGLKLPKPVDQPAEHVETSHAVPLPLRDALQSSGCSSRVRARPGSSPRHPPAASRRRASSSTSGRPSPPTSQIACDSGGHRAAYRLGGIGDIARDARVELHKQPTMGVLVIRLLLTGRKPALRHATTARSFQT
jgi:hypothetical protein